MEIIGGGKRYGKTDSMLKSLPEKITGEVWIYCPNKERAEWISRQHEISDRSDCHVWVGEIEPPTHPPFPFHYLDFIDGEMVPGMLEVPIPTAPKQWVVKLAPLANAL